ncbi:MAG: hypothetical protein GXZ00_00690 [Synergistaceae bacterium]|nr:hypothetical protein [Synergistaceae bacterium]
MNIEQLLDKLDAAETDEEISGIGKAILDIDPQNPYGKLAVWETMDYDDCVENLDMLREALSEIRITISEKETPPNIEEDRDAQTYCTLMMNLGYSLLAEQEVEKALEIAKEFANFDDEGFYPSRTLLYRCMLDLQMYREIFDTLESDPLESVVGEHARAIALIETEAEPGEIRDAINYAISLDPDVSFFVLGIWDFPEAEDDIDDDVEDTVNYAAYVAEPWCSSDKRLAYISAPTFLLGYLTDRLSDEKEIEVLREGYEGAGLLKEVDEAKARILKMGEQSCDPEEIDAVALAETGTIVEKLIG